MSDITIMQNELVTLSNELTTIQNRLRIKYDELEKAVSDRQRERLRLQEQDQVGIAYLTALLMTNDDETGLEFDKELHDFRSQKIRDMGPFRLSGTSYGMAQIGVMLDDQADLQNDAKWAALPQQLMSFITAHRTMSDTVRIDFMRPDLSLRGITTLEYDGERYHHKVMAHYLERSLMSSDAIEPVLVHIRSSLTKMKR